ncbi:WecB/TagA/CpsF family glycosyltransferase [Leifsonia sp. EB34]|uniref:WecB/TagA/CpsF family glycosyltransferase n=1 Tax=Leifsonia sp. EB34 TaxID=3156303 RepID=UPI003513621D
MQTFERAVLGGLQLDRADLDESSRHVIDLARGAGGIVVTSNVSISRHLRTVGLPELEEQTSFWTVDGVPLTWLLRIAGKGRFPRVTGTDLMNAVIEHPTATGLRVGIVGAAAAEAETFYRSRGHAHVHGAALPFAEPGSPALIDAASAFIERVRPDVLFVCLGFPKQERVILELRKRHSDGIVYIGAGAAAQMNTGHFARAPHLMRRLGLEWVWRMGQDPSRLVKRYLLQDLPWLVGMIPVALIERVRSRSGRPATVPRSLAEASGAAGSPAAERADEAA